MRIPVCRSTSAMKSPPLSDSRVALVAQATISSTLCDSAMRRNLDSVWSAALDRGGRQAAAVEAAGAEPDHVFLAVDDLEGQIGAHLDHDHVDRVGSDVDGSDTHAGGGWAELSGLVSLHGRYILAEPAASLLTLLAVFSQVESRSYHEPQKHSLSRADCSRAAPRRSNAISLAPSRATGTGCIRHASHHGVYGKPFRY